MAERIKLTPACRAEIFEKTDADGAHAGQCYLQSRSDMTPLEMARQREAGGGIDYCDECEAFAFVLGAAYCEQSGKLLHPMMLERGQGSGPARNCKHRPKKSSDTSAGTAK